MDFAPLPNLANLVFEQHSGVLCLKTKFLRFHKHIVFRCVSLCFLPAWVLASMSAPFWEPFQIHVNFFSGLTSKLFSDNILNGLGENTYLRKILFGEPFDSLFRSLPEEGSLDAVSVTILVCMLAFV